MYKNGDYIIDLSTLSAIAIEDDTAGAALIKVHLWRLGLPAHLDTVGTSAVDIALGMASPPDLVLTDLHLPVISGYDILRDLRQHPRLDHTKVIAVSASDPHIAIPRCKEAGFDGYIAKPLSKKRFGQQITRVLQGLPVWDSR